MKYDCTKTQDCIHEYHRLCDSYPAGCESSCPFIGANDICGLHIFENEAFIASLQKWSDENPEMPKLTQEEHDFLASFMFPDELGIRKGGVTMQLDTHYSECYSNATIPLRKDMFQFIDEDKDWTVEELLKLEVEE